MLKAKIVNTTTFKEIELEANVTKTIGRGVDTDCVDKRVSRKHAALKFIPGEGVLLDAVHVNPCFVMENGSPPVKVIKKSLKTMLGHGDYLGLVVDSHWFKVDIYQGALVTLPTPDTVVSTIKTEPSILDDTIAVGEPSLAKEEPSTPGHDTRRPDIVNRLSTPPTPDDVRPSTPPTPDNVIKPSTPPTPDDVRPSTPPTPDDVKPPTPPTPDDLARPATPPRKKTPPTLDDVAMPTSPPTPDHVKPITPPTPDDVAMPASPPTPEDVIRPATPPTPDDVEMPATPPPDLGTPDPDPVFRQATPPNPDFVSSRITPPRPNHPPASRTPEPVGSRQETPDTIIQPINSPAVDSGVALSGPSEEREADGRASGLLAVKREPAWGDEGSPVAKRQAMGDNQQSSDAQNATSGTAGPTTLTTFAETTLPPVAASTTVKTEPDQGAAGDTAVPVIAILTTMKPDPDQSCGDSNCASSTPAPNPANAPAPAIPYVPAPAPVPARRPLCQYEGTCYRRNPQHKLEFCHPQDSDWIPLSARELCPYDRTCYRRSRAHRVNMRHTEPPPPRAPRTPATRRSPLEGDSTDDMSDSDSELDYGGLSDSLLDDDDPFATDGDDDDDYMPDSHEE